jgi:hypothetical protein
MRSPKEIAECANRELGLGRYKEKLLALLEEAAEWGRELDNRETADEYRKAALEGANQYQQRIAELEAALAKACEQNVQALADAVSYNISGRALHVEPPTPTDPVNHPSHYTRGGIETINVIEAWQLGFCLGNAIKYISRAGHKGDVLEDLKKARWYIEREIAARSNEDCPRDPGK